VIRSSIAPPLSLLVDPYPRTLDQIFSAETRARLEALGPVTWHDGPPAGAELVDPLLPELTAVIGQTALPAERLARAPHLRAVLNVEGNFLPNVDYGACFARGIEVLGIGPVFAQPVAELALGMALAAARDIPRGDAEIRAGTETMFDDGRNGGSFLLAGTTIGIVGCGNLARTLLPLLRPLRCQLLAHDPWLPDDALRKLGVESVPLVELFTRSRVVFILSPVTTENVGSIGAACFDAMAPGSVVVLVSRAAVVDWPALLAAAARGHIRAAIDVFPEEPIPAGEPARTTPGTILSAHRAGNVPEIWLQVGEMVADDLEALAAGREPERMQRADPLTVDRLRSRPIG
jgi:phosphoglycerate dehydrogenase-like enzyme